MMKELVQVPLMSSRQVSGTNMMQPEEICDSKGGRGTFELGYTTDVHVGVFSCHSVTDSLSSIGGIMAKDRKIVLDIHMMHSVDSWNQSTSGSCPDPVLSNLFYAGSELYVTFNCLTHFHCSRRFPHTTACLPLPDCLRGRDYHRQLCVTGRCCVRFHPVP